MNYKTTQILLLHKYLKSVTSHSYELILLQPGHPLQDDRCLPH